MTNWLIYLTNSITCNCKWNKVIHTQQNSECKKIRTKVFFISFAHCISLSINLLVCSSVHLACVYIYFCKILSVSCCNYIWSNQMSDQLVFVQTNQHWTLSSRYFRFLTCETKITISQIKGEKYCWTKLTHSRIHFSASCIGYI